MSAPIVKEQTQEKLVFGLGQTGLSCVRYLIKQGHTVAVFDTRLNPPLLESLNREFPQVEVSLHDVTDNLFFNVDQIILSPGVSLKSKDLSIAIQNDIEIVGDIELFAANAKAPIIAITGSNGKTTTTTLVGQMLKAAGLTVGIGGNIGTPVLDLLEQATPDYYLLELSSFQLETTKHLKPFIGVILNISADHMDRYENLDEYALAKFSILDNATHKIINIDDQWLLKQLSSMSDDNYIGFAQSPSPKNQFALQQIDNELWIVSNSKKLCSTTSFKLQGKHQLMNVVAAIAIAELCEVNREVYCQVANDFDGLSHRTQYVETIDGVNYINDSKGTNVGATVAAINGFDSAIILLAGGDGKDADFTELTSAVKNKVRYAILFGRDAGLIEKAIGQSTTVIRTVSLEAAVAQAHELAIENDTVLLSPACASFDMFDNYQHRGDAFIKLVKGLANHG